MSISYLLYSIIINVVYLIFPNKATRSSGGRTTVIKKSLYFIVLVVLLKKNYKKLEIYL